MKNANKLVSGKYWFFSTAVKAFVLVFLWSFASVHAVAKEPITPRQFIDLAGLDTLPKRLGPALKQLVDKPPLSKLQILRKPWIKAADLAFDETRMTNIMVEEMAGAIAPAALKDFIAFLETPFGKRVTALERAAQSPNAAEKSQIRGAELYASYDQHRKKLLAEMTRNLGSIENGVAIGLNAGFNMIKGMQAAGRVPAQMSDQQIRKTMAAQTSKIRQAVIKSNQNAMAFTYDTLSLSQLQKYADFLSSKSGRAVYAQISEVISRLLSRVAYLFGQELTKQIRAKKT